MRNNKGFTLIELMAMLLVLAILMAITVPNITGIMNNQKNSMFKNSAITMIETAKSKVARMKTIKKPEDGECNIFSLDYLDDTEDLVNGPYGGNFLRYDSFVIYTREGNQYKYYVRLMEEKESTHFGIELADLNAIKNTPDIIKEFKTGYFITSRLAEDEVVAMLTSKIQGKCTGGIVKYY